MKTSWIRRRRGWLLVTAAVGAVAAAVPAAPAAARPAAGGPRYEATIVRTAYGIPHITAHSFGSLGYGYGFALASDNLCTMADEYLTVEGQRSRYLGPCGGESVWGTSSPGAPRDPMDGHFCGIHTSCAGFQPG